MSEKRVTERIYYVYILYWYDLSPKAEIRTDALGNDYAVCIREHGEADPVVMTDKQKLQTIVKARTGREDWQTIQENRLWRLGNYWLKRDILGFDIKLDEMEYVENWKEIHADGSWTTYRKLNSETGNPPATPRADEYDRQSPD